MKKLKALLINGSPRAKGCTYTALTELKNTLEQEGYGGCAYPCRSQGCARLYRL